MGLGVVAAGAGLDALPAEKGEVVFVDLGAEQRGDDAELPPGEGLVIRMGVDARQVPGVQDGVPHPVMPHAEEDLAGPGVLLVDQQILMPVSALDAQHLGADEGGLPESFFDVPGQMPGPPLGLRTGIGLPQHFLKGSLAMHLPAAQARVHDAAGNGLIQHLQRTAAAVQKGQRKGVVKVAGGHG